MKNNNPKKGSRQWINNEKLIGKNPVLRGARDRSEGFKPSSGISTGATDEQYKSNYDKIDWSNRDQTPKKFKVRVNGKLINPDEEA